jgi:GNAT superfamily N-acetyltransferase
MNKLLFLQYLIYMGLSNQSADYSTEHCFAMKSGSMLPFCNRVCAGGDISPNEIEDIRSFYGQIPFRWFVDARDKQIIATLEQQRFEHQTSYPAMIMDLDKVKIETYGTGIELQEVSSHSLEAWLSIVCTSYSIKDQDQFAHFITYLIERADISRLRFYIGLYQGVPATASMTIQHGDTLGLHWVATLPEYRGKGLGFAISHKPLLDAVDAGCKQAILLASDMGKPVYERIGFKEYALYNVYR